MQEPSVADRRRFRRYPIDVPVKVFRNGDQQISGRGTNISAGGLQVLVAAKFELAEQLEVEISLPYYSSQVLRLPCVVRNNNGYNHGVEFLPSKPEHRDVIDRVCSILSLIHDREM